MTITIDVTPDRETHLRQQAERAGLTLDEWINRVVDNIADAETLEGRGGDGDSRTARAARSERIARFQAWADGHADTPHLDDEAISREAIYGGLNDGGRDA